ncbi:MAG: polysaccharide deacetylase family protein, partial [Oscillospiraceae bacterium]|nr:polysaccharide deacetylase family protein [Oscillospiraceae bacterium]
IVAQGCEVASHSYSHERLTRLGRGALYKDLERTTQALEEFSGTAPRLLRPPFGAVNERMLDCVDMPVILWSIDSEDWRYCELLCKNRSDEQRQRDLLKVVNGVLDYVQDGDIILMHDLYSFTQDVADTVIAELHHQGWQLVTVSELFAAKGIEPEPGEVYHSAR